MKITIKETGAEKALTLLDLKTGLDWSADFIAGRNIETDEDGNSVMDQAAFAWWQQVISDRQTNDSRANAMRERGINMAQYEENYPECDVEDEGALARTLLDEIEKAQTPLAITKGNDGQWADEDGTVWHMIGDEKWQSESGEIRDDSTMDYA